MNITRDKTLPIPGGGVITVAGLVTAAFGGTRTTQRELAPWMKAGGYRDPAKNALWCAIPAPNPLTLQPWMLDLPAKDTVVPYRDPEKAPPHADPFSRRITVGLGRFLEQMKIAASQTGHRIGLDLFPQGKSGPLPLRAGSG